VKKLIAIIIISSIGFSSCGLLTKKSLQKDPLAEQKFQYHLLEASKSKMLGNIHEAILHLSRCIAFDPNSALAHYEIAGLYLHLGDPDKAILFARKAVQLNNNNDWYKILLAEIFKATGRLNEATAIYKELNILNPDVLDYYYELAMLYSITRKYEDALNILNIIEREFGYNELLALERENIYMITGKQEQAFDEIKKLISYYPNEPRYLGLLAESYMLNQRYDDAYSFYQQMLAVDSTNGLLRLSLADYYRIHREYDKAFNELRLAFASSDVNVETKIRMLVAMLTFMDINDELNEQIFSLLNILLETHPNDAETHAFYADYLINNHEYKQARDKLRDVLAIDKQQYFIWEQLLILNSQIDDNESLLKDSNNALEYFPNQPLIYYFKGLAQYFLKDYASAIKSLKTGVSLVINNAPLQVQFYSLLAESYNGNKDYELSDKTMEKVLSLDPQNLPILNNYAYYLSLRNKNLDKAEEMSKKTIEIEPNNHTYLDTYAWILYKQGKYLQAEKYIIKSLDKGGKNNGIIIEHYGDILYKLNKKEDAILMWKKASEIGGNTSSFLNAKIESKTLIE